MIFWALEERRKWRAKWRAESYAVGYAEGVAATKQRYESWLAKVAEDKTIPLADLLMPSDYRAR